MAAFYSNVLRPPICHSDLAPAGAIGCSPGSNSICGFPHVQLLLDGVIFSLGIESASGAGIAPLIVPNHLLYSVLGFGIILAFPPALAAVRALPVLQLLDTIASLLSALLLFRLLYRLFEERYAALALTAIFAFGATWWKYSVDADAYIVSTLFILAAATRLLLHGTRRLWITGAWHCRHGDASTRDTFCLQFG